MAVYTYRNNRTKRKARTMWKHETRNIYGQIFEIDYKQYDEASEYGIDGGRISKLEIRRNHRRVASYDRGWILHPVDAYTEFALELFLHNENW